MDRIATVREQVQIKEWAEMVCVCRNSGMSVRRWCVANGVNQTTYYYRLRKVHEFICEEQHDIVPITCDIPTPKSLDIKIQVRQYEHNNTVFGIAGDIVRNYRSVKMLGGIHLQAS